MTSAEIAAWPLARTRIIIGILAFVRGLEGLRVLRHVTEPGMLRLPYIAGMPVLARGEVFWLAGTWLLAALAFAVGWRTRVAGVVLMLVLVRVLTADQQAYSSHLYLLLVLISTLTCGQSSGVASLDARLDGPRERVPGWPVWLLAVQGTLVYGYAAVDKLIPAYLSGAVLCAHFGWLHHQPPPVMICAALALGSIVTELFLAFGLWRRRLWLVACAVGIGLHVAMVVMLSSEVRLQLIVFAGEMLVLYPLYPIASQMMQPARGVPDLSGRG
jgi:hypothetical protein